MRRVVVSEFVTVDGVMEDPVEPRGSTAAAGPSSPTAGPMAKFVVSATLQDPEWNNSTVIKGNVAEEVSKLKQPPGEDILVNGSAQLVRALVEHDLVDEYRLMIHPLVMGSGKRLFREGGGKIPMRLLDSSTSGTGVLIVTYEPER